VQVLDERIAQHRLVAGRRMMAGIDVNPPLWPLASDAPPITSSKRPGPDARTTTGCNSPTSVIDATSSACASASKLVLGCRGLGLIDAGSSSA
jgi:hypothetical protein